MSSCPRVPASDSSLQTRRREKSDLQAFRVSLLRTRTAEPPPYHGGSQDGVDGETVGFIRTAGLRMEGFATLRYSTAARSKAKGTVLVTAASGRGPDTGGLRDRVPAAMG